MDAILRKSAVYHNRSWTWLQLCPSKYIKILLLAIKDVISRQEVKLQYCPTKNNAADMITKPLLRQAQIMISDDSNAVG